MGVVGTDSMKLHDESIQESTLDDHRCRVFVGPDVERTKNHSQLHDEISNQKSDLTCLSTDSSSLPSIIAPLPLEEIDRTAILESRILVHLAEQTSHEMQQVVAWWIKYKENKCAILDQEEALPNNMLVHQTDWGATTFPETSEEALNLPSSISTPAKSRAEALQQSHLVDLVENRTRAMADFVSEFQRISETFDKSENQFCYSTSDSKISKIGELPSAKRKAFPKWFTQVLLLSCVFVIAVLTSILALSHSDASLLQFLNTRTPPDNRSDSHNTCPLGDENLVGFRSPTSNETFCWKEMFSF